MTTAEQTKKKLPWWAEALIMFLAVIFLSGCLQTFVGRIYVIPSGSMEPTLHGCTNCVNDKIFVNKITPHFHSPEQGDIIVFKGPPSWNVGYVEPRSKNKLIAVTQDVGTFFGVVVPKENTLVKRVAAVGGQTIRCLPEDPGVMVDGQVINDSFILDPPQRTVAPELKNCGGKFFGPITVPRGHVFVMGDNRTNSADSRFHTEDSLYGTIPEKNIIGYPQLIVYPFNRMQTIEKEAL